MFDCHRSPRSQVHFLICRIAPRLAAGALALAMVGCAKDPPPGGLGGAGGQGAPSGDPATAPVVGTVTLPATAARNLEPFAFGQNYWNWEPTWGNPIAGTETMAAAAGVKLIRAGGANNEQQTPNVFSNAELDRFVGYCRAAGAEPLLQVPLIKSSAAQAATAADAAAMVTYANVTQSYGIKYWSIGNEPDLYFDQMLMPASYSAASYCATFKEYVAAMKAADPSIKILGPELSWKYIPGNDWLTPFLDGCKDVVDVVSVHRYAFAPTATTIAAALGDATSFRQSVRTLRANLDAHGMTSTPLAITEEHITYDGAPEHSTLPASPQTFYAGLWAADVLGVALEEGLWTSAFWHIADATTGWKLAFILGTQPQPTYYATSLMANHAGPTVLKPSGVPAGFSVYATRDAAAGKTFVTVLNKATAAARLTFMREGAAPRTLGFAGESLTVAVLTDDGVGEEVWRYRKDLADAGQAPALGE